MRSTWIVLSLLLLSSFGAASLAAGDDVEMRRYDLGALVLPRWNEEAPLLGANAPMYAAASAEPPEPEAYLSADEVVELVRSLVDRASWDELDGAELSVNGATLVARNRGTTLDEVGAFLAALSAAARGGLDLQVQVLSAPTPSWPSAPDGAEQAASGTLVLPFGARRVLTDTERVSFVADYDVEIAQGSEIADPIVVTADQGLAVEAVAHPASDGQRALLDLFLQWARYGKSRTMDTGVDEEYLPRPYRSDERMRNGRIELPQYDHVQAHVSTFVGADGTFSVPVVVGGRTLELRGSVSRFDNPPVPSAVSVGALAARPFHLRFGIPGEVDRPDRFAPRAYRETEEPAPLDADSLLEGIRRDVDPEVWESEGVVADRFRGKIFLSAPDRARENARTYVAAREAEALRPVRVDLQVFSTAGAIPPGPGRQVPREGATLLDAGRLETLSGRAASLLAGNTANYLADYDVEVAQESRIADPIIGQAFDGLVLNLVPHVGLGARTITIELQLLRARRRIGEEPYRSGTRYLGPVDHVRTDRALVHTTLEVPAGGTYVLDLGPDPDAPGRHVSLEVSAAVR